MIRKLKRPAARACALLCAAAVCLVLLPLTPAPAGTLAPLGWPIVRKAVTGYTPATFDLYSAYPQQPLAPATGLLQTSMPVETRNIGDTSGEVVLAAAPDSAYFTTKVEPPKVSPAGKDAVAKSRVTVRCAKGTPEGTVGWIEVTGRRGTEEHHLWLQANTEASAPKLELSKGVPLTGQGHVDATTRAYVGKPLTWHVSAKNTGGAADRYALSCKSAVPVKVSWKDARGKTVTSVTRPATTRNLDFSKPAELTATVSPQGQLPRNQPVDVTLVLGPGGHTGKTSEVTVKLLDPGMLNCVNDLAGSQPHPHQVMPGEKTSYIFHVSNTGKSAEDVDLALAGSTAGWVVDPSQAALKGLQPGETKDATVMVSPPAGAQPGDHGEFTFTASSSSGHQESATVAADVTDQRNVYYWSVDSMDPEYLNMNRAGSGAGRQGDWLMPNMHAFMQQSVDYSDARCYLPSATDMNHTNALAGTMTGTMGIYMVSATFYGFDQHDRVLAKDNTLKVLRYGPDGQPVQRAYEVAKQVTGGKALTGFWSNKNWLAKLEGEQGVDVVGHSEQWPLFFPPPYKYNAAGDPQTDNNPADRLSASFRSCIHSTDPRAIVIPTILGEFDMVLGMKLLSMPIEMLFGRTPGMHAEDRYITSSFFRTIEEQDPDVAYINIGDLDNTGHFTGSSWDPSQWQHKGGGTDFSNDVNKYSPYPRREEALDICREADSLFADFVKLLKARGVYDNSVIVFLSDHGMENMKDPKSGYQVIDLRQVLREKGLVHAEDYQEVGGTEINLIWAQDPAKRAAIQQILEDYTINDPQLGLVKPLTVVGRKEMLEGADYGAAGHIRPGELYSEYWVNNPGGADGEIWPDLFIFPLYNYQVMLHGGALATGINNVGFSLGIQVPDDTQFGFPGAHGGLQTDRIPLIFKPPAGDPAYRPGTQYTGEVAIGDIAPTIYGITGWPVPGCVDGKPLPTP